MTLWSFNVLSKKLWTIKFKFFNAHDTEFIDLVYNYALRLTNYCTSYRHITWKHIYAEYRKSIVSETIEMGWVQGEPHGTKTFIQHLRWKLALFYTVLLMDKMLELVH